jgi:hypothetical protein
MTTKELDRSGAGLEKFCHSSFDGLMTNGRRARERVPSYD